MKTRILMYSSKELNKIVQKYVELDKTSEHVYTFLVDKNKYDDPEQDLLDVVLCTSNVYWREATYQRKTLSQPGFVESEEYLALHLAEHIDQIMRRGDFLKNLYVKIYEELGFNTAPLIEYQQKRTERIHTESVRLQQQEQAKETQVQQQEQERLESEKEKFNAGNFIDMNDFLALCKQAGVVIPLRTHGTFNARVINVSPKQIEYRIIPKKRAPKLDGCFKIINAYLRIVSAEAAANNQTEDAKSII